MDILIGIPILLMTTMLQVSTISRLPLIHGTADLTLLVLIAWSILSRSKTAWIWAIIAGLIVGFYSQINWMAMVLPYLIIIILAQFIHRNLLNTPILVIFLMSIVGSLLVQLVTLAFLFFAEISINFGQAFSEIMLPSIFLNLLLALPVYFLIKDLSRWVYPQVENE